MRPCDYRLSAAGLLTLAVLALMTLLTSYSRRPGWAGSGSPHQALAGADVRENASVFFVETDAGLRRFDGRRLCAFESTASANPGRDVIVLLPLDSSLDPVSWPAGPGPAPPNLRFVRVDYESLVKGSAAGGFWKNKGSKHWKVQLSDVVRMLVLDKFGGAYLDSDIVSLAAIPEDLPAGNNFLAEDFFLPKINQGVIQFSKGHPFVKKVLQEIGGIALSHRNSLGPLLVTGLSKEACPDRNNATGDKRISYVCKGFNYSVLSKTVVHPLDTYDYNNPGADQAVGAAAANSDSFLLHYFGSKFVYLKFVRGSPLHRLVDRRCPLSRVILAQELDARDDYERNRVVIPVFLLVCLVGYLGYWLRNRPWSKEARERKLMEFCEQHVS